MPRGTKAPKLCPAEPVKVSEMVSSGSPAAPKRRLISEPSRVPTVRSTLEMGRVTETGVPSVNEAAHASMN